MKPKEIQELLEFIAQSGLEEVNIETEQLKLSTKRNAAAAQIITQQTPQILSAPIVQQPIPVSNATPKTESKVESAAAPDDSKYKTIKSPMIGTFYRSPGPNEDVFVNVGDSVNVGTTVCIIEAMKLFNEIESEFAGKIVKILVQDASPVEYDQPLFVIDPS
ncbi:MAG: acetyl-CoA carboxylase biotin carboxyl carrier protein [Bacteroidota bacterium]|nr:acetyl-CoA carboxylase biotin carboxyl carrier protein [Bacteroidota bacterium]